MFHQHEVRLAAAIHRMVAVHGKQRQHVGAVIQFAHIVAGARAVGAVELQHEAPAIRAQEINCPGVVIEAVARDRVHADAAQHLLAEFPVRFQPVAERAAADHLEATPPQRVLFLALECRFEQHDALATGVAQPAQLGPPVGYKVQHAGVDIPAGLVLDEHLHFVAAQQQAVVHRGEVVALADAEKSHFPGLCATRATAAIRSASR